MPVAETELHYTTPFELLVAVILSAQCTDKRVNMITPRLFREYPTAEIMARAEVDDIFELVRSISYPRAKAGYLVSMAQRLVADHQGEVPEEREELMKLPGVGRKTANVIASVIFNRPTMAVDTHVFPKAHHWLILHGRYVCTARKPQCSTCGLSPYCRYFASSERKKLKSKE